MYVRRLSSADEVEQAAAESYVPFAIGEAPQRFRMQFALHNLSDTVTTSRVRATPARTVRTPRMVARTVRDDLLLFCVQVSGAGRLGHHDRFAELSRGSGVLSEARSPWELDLPVANQSMTLQFPRQLLGMSSAQISDACARRLDPRAPAMRLVAGYLGQLQALADDLSEGERCAAGQAAVDLAAMALRGAAPAVPGGGSDASEVVLAMLRSYVRDHLGDPRLTVAELAHRHHVSVRQVHALFARAGGTPAAYIREQRLLAARAMLAARGQRTRAVAEIAAAVGFAEPRTFERAFRRQYGSAPARWRRESGEWPGAGTDTGTRTGTGAT